MYFTVYTVVRVTPAQIVNMHDIAKIFHARALYSVIKKSFYTLHNLIGL